MAKSAIGVGSVVEIATVGRLTYALCVYRDPIYGLLWRIIDKTVDARPTDIEAFVRQPERFFVFSPIGAVIGGGAFERIATVTLPPELAILPTLRWPIYRPGSNQVLRWKLWTGSAGSLPLAGPEHADLSILQVTHPRALLERLEAGWRPRDRPVDATPATDGATSGAVQWVLELPDRLSAESAIERLRTDGWNAEARTSEGSFGVVASRSSTGSIAATRVDLERLAHEHGGTVAGWGIEMTPIRGGPSEATRTN